MGFHEAISGSGWDPAKQAAAFALCDRIRDCLRRTDFPADPDRVYNNLNSDPSIPDGPAPSHPTSRLECLDELVGKGPTLTGDALKDAMAEFCRRHKQEGPEDTAARGRVLGRVVAFRSFEGLFLKKDNPKNLRTGTRFRRAIRDGQLEEQRKVFGPIRLGGKLVWSFYDSDDVADPFRSFNRGAANMIDRLGLGQEWKDGGKFVQWGQRLPTRLSAHAPTAWDGGADRPWWHPGGRTRPLSADGGGAQDTSLGPGDGVPEVVHDPLTGRELAIPITFVAT